MGNRKKRSVEPGHVVVSAAGRDRNRVFLVTGTVRRNGYDAAVIADGKLHRTGSGKIKNMSHLKTIGVWEGFSAEEVLTDEKAAEICRRFDPKTEKLDNGQRPGSSACAAQDPV